MTSPGGAAWAAAASTSPLPTQLAAMVMHVAYADRSDVRVLRIDAGSSAALQGLARSLGLETFDVSSACDVGGCWWSRPTPTQALTIGPAATLRRVAAAVGRHAARTPQVRVRPVDENDAVLVIKGRTADVLVDRLGGPAPSSRPACTVGSLAGTEVTWLATSSESVVIVYRAGQRAPIVAAIEEQGRPLHMLRVGPEALAFFELRERRQIAERERERRHATRLADVPAGVAGARMR